MLKVFKDELIYKKKIINALKEDGIIAKFNEITILGLHNTKLNYNFVYNNKKYLFKKELFQNIENENYCAIYPLLNKDTKKIFKEENRKQTILLQKEFDTLEFNRYDHFPNILEITSNFYVVEYYTDLQFLSKKEFFDRSDELMKLYTFDIIPMSISKINLGLVDNKIKFFDFDALTMMKFKVREYIHFRDNDDGDEYILYKGNVEDVKIFHEDMKNKLKEYKD